MLADPPTVPPLAGRETEIDALMQGAEEAAEGSPRAIFVRGEAGVGKTQLVSAAAGRMRDLGFRVVWASCVRFGAVESPFLPWVTAVEQWWATAPRAEQTRIMARVPALRSIVDPVAAAELVPTTPMQWVRELRSFVRGIAEGAPVLLVLDDAQWADSASRDALMYLITAMTTERLLVLATVRDEGLIDDGTHAWLADLRRLRQVVDLSLHRFSSAETAAQMRLLLDAEPPLGLVADVFQRGDGNPYLTELLCQSIKSHGDRAVSGGASLQPRQLPERLPGGVPDDLAAALLAAWRRLSGPSREVSRILAIAGRGVSADRLHQVCIEVGVPATDVPHAVNEAVEAGLLVPTAQTVVWFRHPLLAEVLTNTYLPGQARPAHAAWARQFESICAEGVDEVRRLGALALHYQGAGQLTRCLTTSLAAADEAAAEHLWVEEAAHLSRAMSLLDRNRLDLPEPYARGRILERVGLAHMYVGQRQLGRNALQKAADSAMAEGDILTVCRARCQITELEWSASGADETLQNVRDIIALSSEQPDSYEHAWAWAALAERFIWSDSYPAAREAAAEALAAAERSGSAAAMCKAHQAWVLASADTPGSGFEHVEECLRWAHQSDDPILVLEGLSMRAWFYDVAGRKAETADALRAAVRLDFQLGFLAGVVANSGMLAATLVDLGRLAEAHDVIVEALSVVREYSGQSLLRLAAAELAIRRGDLDAADQHLARAYELEPDLETRIGLESAPRIAEHLLAHRRPRDAIDLIERALPLAPGDPDMRDMLLLWAARATTSLVETARDSEDRTAADDATQRLRQLVATWSPTPIGTPSTRRDARGSATDATTAAMPSPVQAARRALLAAEVASVIDPRAASGWPAAINAADAADLRWDAAAARVRHAQLLSAAGAPRAEVARELRAAHQFATEQTALPLLREAETLALASAIPLNDPESLHMGTTTPGKEGRQRNRLSGLTPREHEVLRHVVAGRTYAEIAAQLHISEKTVSVHVSNMLRKSGTTTRREIATLALRIGVDVPT